MDGGLFPPKRLLFFPFRSEFPVAVLMQLGSAVVSTASSRRLADWLPANLNSPYSELVQITDVFGETPKTAVETTALPIIN
ncbi:MAG TPA: hypothetical protein VGO67_07810 [Verrucomicrobiae bacterium]